MKSYFTLESALAGLGTLILFIVAFINGYALNVFWPVIVAFCFGLEIGTIHEKQKRAANRAWLEAGKHE